MPLQDLRPCGPIAARRAKLCVAFTDAWEVAILLAMATSEQVPLAEVKNRLSEVVDRLEREHGRVIITKHGRPAAVLLSLEDLESLEETLAVMGNPTLVEELREAEDGVATGQTTPLTREEALARVRRS